MIYGKNLRKRMALIIIFTFVFQADLFLFTQEDDDVNNQFELTKSQYINGQYGELKGRLERLVGTIVEKQLEEEKKNILGSCYLLLGAICEKEGDKECAGKNYDRAKDYGIKKIDGITEIDGKDSDDLTLYRKIVFGEETQIKPIVIEKPVKGEKKKFPVFLVIGGVIIVVAAVLLLKKKPKPSSTPAFITSTNSLNVPEGGIADFNVRLSAQPSSTVSVSVTRVSGDTDINVQSGSSLTFNTGNWNQNQTVTLAANDDVDTANDQAVIRISAAGIQAKDITATESDKGCIISVNITSPTNNGSVSGIVNIQATVTSNCAVDRVEFYIDNVLKGTDTSAPYSYGWDTTTAFEGPHGLHVVAYTASSNNSSQITVNVTR